MGKIDCREVSNQLSFSMVDVPVLIDILKSLNSDIKTTSDVIHYWDMCCFRANTIDEIVEQFDDDEEIKRQVQYRLEDEFYNIINKTHEIIESLDDICDKLEN